MVPLPFLSMMWSMIYNKHYFHQATPSLGPNYMSKQILPVLPNLLHIIAAQQKLTRSLLCFSLHGVLCNSSCSSFYCSCICVLSILYVWKIDYWDCRLYLFICFTHSIVSVLVLYKYTIETILILKWPYCMYRSKWEMVQLERILLWRKMMQVT